MDEISEIARVGIRLEALGKALQDPDVEMSHLGKLAHDCGFCLRVGIFKYEDSNSPPNGDTHE